MRHATLVVLLLVGACSISEKDYNPPYSCYHEALPVTANDPVTIGATIIDGYTGMPVMDAQIEAYLISPPEKMFGPIPAAPDGTFSQSQTTLGVPRDIYLRVTAPGFVETRYYPAVPITSDFHTQIAMFTMNEVGLLGMAIMDQPQISMTILAVTAVDCNDKPLGDAHITTTPTSSVFYLDSTLTPAPGRESTDPKTGTGLIPNITPTTINITGTVSGTDLGPRTVSAVAGVVVATEIQPAPL